MTKRAKAVGRVLGVACLAGFMVAPRAAGQQEAGQPDTVRFGNPTDIARTLQGYVYGVVKKVGPNELILDKTEFGDAQVFKLEAKTRYIHDGKPSALAQLKVGDNVWVDMKKDKRTGDMIAKKVVTGVSPTVTPR